MIKTYFHYFQGHSYDDWMLLDKGICIPENQKPIMYPTINIYINIGIIKLK
jgi:hypothetical protein